MKTKNNNMKIMKTESTANEQERKEAKYKPVTPVILDNVSEDVTFIRSADVCKLLNVSNSTLRNLRAAQAIPFYKLGGTFLYNKRVRSAFVSGRTSKPCLFKGRIIP